MNSPDFSQRAEGINSIAHLFLSQSSQDETTGKPHRCPPRPSSSSPTGKSTGHPISADALDTRFPTSNQDSRSPADIENPSGFIEDQAAPNGGLPDNPTGAEQIDYDSIINQQEAIPGEILLVSHLEEPLEKARQYANFLSQHDQVVLIDIDSKQARIIPLESTPETGDEEPIVIAETVNISETLIPALKELAYDFDYLLVNIDKTFKPRLDELTRHCTQITVLSSCESAEIVETYKTIKDIAGGISPDHEISLFVCDAPETKTADNVYYKLADAARQFLDLILIPGGCYPQTDGEISQNLPISEAYKSKPFRNEQLTK